MFTSDTCGQLADPKEEIAIFKTCIIGGRLEGHHPKSILIPIEVPIHHVSHSYLYTKKSDKLFSNFYFFCLKQSCRCNLYVLGV